MTEHRSRDRAAPYDPTPVGWSVAQGHVGYEDAVAAMEARAGRIAAGDADELVWLVEHPPIYTAGTSARDEDLLTPDRFPVFRTGRGGQYTYHGPGQRVVYVMLDVKRRTGDVRAFVGLLERWTIAALDELGVRGETRRDRVGVWVPRPDGVGEDKIAAIGIRVRRWVSFHGISINVAPDLSHFDGIVPCGVAEHGITSLAALGRASGGMPDLDRVLEETFRAIVAPTVAAPSPLLQQADE